MYKSGVAAPVLPAESTLTEAQKRAALAHGHGVSVINPEAEYLARVRREQAPASAQSGNPSLAIK